MDRKYTPHIRIPFSIFANPKYKQIPDTFKPYCLSVLVCLLKFVNNKTGKCYPRQATIVDMIGLSRTTIYRATIQLKKAKIIQIKRLSSTLLYTIDPDFIYGDVSKRNNDVSYLNIDVSDRPILIKHNTIPNTISNITSLIKKISNKGGDQEKIVLGLATSLTPAQLQEGISNNDNPYYCKLALEERLRMDKKLVDIPKVIVDNVRKRTNYFYKKKVHENKVKHGRETKTESFLSRHDKSKSEDR